jgi:hypothetical protein
MMFRSQRCSKELWSGLAFRPPVGLPGLMSRYDREKIYQEIWPNRFKTSEDTTVGLAKVCRKLNIPRAGRGYRALKGAGNV